MAVKVLITGATGYIGGSVLSTLLESAKDSEPDISISALIRGEEKIKLYEDNGVHPILFKSLDESEVLQKAASQHDVVIHTATGFHEASAKALILGLADRAKETRKEVHYIHTSGTSDLADQPITGKYHEDHIFSDKENIYAYERNRENLQPYPQRTTDLTVVETGLAHGVKTTIIMSPTIYGVGTGLFNKLSIQAPTIARTALKDGQVIVAGEGKGIWNYVHIADLVKLYKLVLEKVIAGEKVPSGENGILFSATGSFTWLELSSGVAKALFELGAIETDVVKQVGIEDVAEKWFRGHLIYAELSYASNSRTTSDVSRSLGWEPQKTDADFRNHFLEEARLILAELPKTAA